MKKPPIDPTIATLVGALFGGLGVFGVFTQLELDADQVAMLTGFAGAALTAIRTLWLRRAYKAEGDGG